MFGLMRAQYCSQPLAVREAQRQHYCGVCKSLGGLYGQRTRFLLNHDVVFLAELLSALSNESKDEWEYAYRSLNCLALPANEHDVPLVLQFAATANLALTQAKLRDHLDDAPALKWRAANQILLEPFEQALTRLRAWSFPVVELEQLSGLQREREVAATVGETTMAKLAEPTAVITASFFRCGVRLIGRAELEGQAARLGFSFGELAYWLDALGDYEKDAQAGQFNGLSAAFGWQLATIQADERLQALEGVRVLFKQIVEQLHDLPFPASLATSYAERLRLNLSRELNVTLEVETTRTNCRRRSPGLPSSRLARVQLVLRDLWRKHSEVDCAWWERAFAPLAYFSVLIGALFLPTWLDRVRSWRDGYGLATNLMFIGALPAAMMSSVSLWPWPKKQNKHHQEKNSWCDFCDCDCCECCCECDGCHCNCCEGCCDGCSCDCGH